LTAKVVEVGEDFRAVPAEMEKNITENTVLLVASAPSYPQGVVDPVEAIAAIAKERKILCHVDSCVGGFMLPFLKALNYPIPNFDFSVEGVTSMSADIHKYGYAAKGASIVLYKNAELRKLQFYAYTHWSGGIYGSPSMAGTRPGGSIAAAWAALKFIGMEGYCEKAKICIETTHKLKKAIEAFPELKILSNPDMTILCVASDDLDIYEVGDELGILGWTIDRQQLPPSLHLTITPAHEHVIDDFVKDLNIAIQKAKQLSINKLSKVIQVNTVKGIKKILPESLMARFQTFASKHSKVGGKRSAAMYGMMGELQDTANLDEMVIDFLDKLTRNQN
jgi:glutamate/tyrosine decarboxylase-like PLP-dependent enzyme